ncbi:hypothetical protein C0Q70_21079 [Pomacea canaliculata]|uniref:Uncharacterized protein n=1 Tax=Pomacea canaliculata TaxID=400727 RepID=A0A2T7NBH9_POMCA|nr:hypothetical protein C0Q70_21079 [Pomacea canaliculata]
MADIYLPLPVDRKQMQEKKLAKLQQEIAEMEQRIQENVALRQHLESISDAENERTQRLLDRLSGRNMLLKDEIERLYGHSKDPQASPSTARLVNEVISQRTKEFSQLQQEKAMQIKYLMIEKQRLQEAQERLRLKRQMVMRQPTPIDGKDASRRPSLSSVHSTSSLVKRAVNAMPQTVDRIKYLKATLQHDYERRKKPYNGELGVNSYKPWQMEDYVIVRSLVEEIIDDFIAQYVPSAYGHGERDIIQKDVWAHSQDLHTPSQLSGQENGEKVDADTEVITFFHLHPSHLKKFEKGPLDPPEVCRKMERAAIYKRREAQFWKVGTQADRNTISALALQADQHGNIPLVLQLLGSLDVDQDDFTFHIGPLKELGLLKASNLPTKGVFFPSLSIFGIQHSVCIGLDSGDLLKINVEPFSSSSDVKAHGESSDKPYIFYQPNIYDVGHDVNLIGQNLEAEMFRHHVSTLIFLGFINNINQMVTVDMNGSINIWRYDLQFFLTQIFREEAKQKLPQRGRLVRSTKLLSVCQTPSGRELVFVLLFPEFPPKEPHITVLVLDLSTMQLRDLRCDIHLNATDYASLLQDDTFHVIGLVQCISLTTGNRVLRAENPLKPSGFIGSTIDERQLKLSKMARVSSISCNGHIYALLHDKSSTTMNIVQLQDSNEEEVCQLMWKSYQLSGHYRQVPPELRVDRVTWVLSDMQYADVEMRHLLLDLVDEKIFKVQPGLDKEADAAQNLRDKTEQYTVMQAKVDKMALLDL